ncbi:MAG: hypothetical protein HOW73_19840 [Polyangiaceae bacterium]|nr:hypothetical protein [Polyangiaceae bacterium]
MRRCWLLLGALLTVGALSGCGDETKLAPEASGSALGASSAKTKDAKPYGVDTGASMVGFNMDAPDEKIRGKAIQAVSGSIFIDPKDLSQTTGNIVVDIDKLKLYQTVKDDEGNFKAEQEHPKQNQHARQWLEIDESAPEKDRKENSRVEFKIDSIEGLSEKDLTKLQGAERTVTFKAKGDFLLHKRTTKKTVDMQATFKMDGDKISELRLKTVSPFGVGLAEHDVRPREGFGKLAAKTLDALGSKVAKEAQVEFELRLMPEGGTAAAPMTADAVPMAPTAEPSAAASASAGPSASAGASVSAGPSKPSK